MSKKILTIQVLKQRIFNMQQELNKLQNNKKQHQQRSKSKSLKRSKQKSQTFFRNTSTNKRYKSPTFWTGNTLLAQQNPYLNSPQVPLTPSPKAKRNNKIFNKSPLLKKITNDVDLSYYQSAPVEEKNKQNFTFSDKKNNGPEDNKRFLMELNRQIPKVQKKKTYQIPRKNPILNPQPPKPIGRKIAIRPSLSPQNMYVQNPRSNPNIYFKPNSTQPIFLSKSPKHVQYFNRNNSPDLKLLLSNSAQNLKFLSPSYHSGKKHYGKYYQENFSSKWNVGW